MHIQHTYLTEKTVQITGICSDGLRTPPINIYLQFTGKQIPKQHFTRTREFPFSSGRRRIRI